METGERQEESMQLGGRRAKADWALSVFVQAAKEMRQTGKQGCSGTKERKPIASAPKRERGESGGEGIDAGLCLDRRARCEIVGGLGLRWEARVGAI